MEAQERYEADIKKMMESNNMDYQTAKECVDSYYEEQATFEQRWADEYQSMLEEQAEWEDEQHVIHLAESQRKDVSLFDDELPF